MNRKLMVGVLTLALAVGGFIGVNTWGTSEAASEFSKSRTSSNAMISIAEAKQIALAQVYGGGWVESVELERDDGKVYYEVEIEAKDWEYEIEVDAYTGKILDIEKERERNGRRHQADYITLEQAVEIALEKAPGRVKEVERDRDDGRVYFEIEIDTKHGEVEIEIDARTGNIISVEYDD